MNKDRKTLFVAWFLVSMFYAYQYILRVMPSILMDDIVQKFSLSPDAFGQFSGVYYLGYTLMHLPVAIFLDRFGPKKVLPILIASTSIGLLPILYADSFIYPIIGRVLIGIGSSGAILGVFKILHLYFEAKKFSRFLSFSVTIGLLGAIYGGAPIHFTREHFGFESVVYSLLVVSIILAVLSYIFIPTSPVEQTRKPILKNLKSVFTNKTLLLLCFVAGFMVGPLEGFADVWGVQFLKIFHGMQDAVASGLPSWIYFGMGVGGPFLSFVVEKTSKPLEVVLACSIVMCAAFALLISVPMSAFALSALFFVVGMCCAYQILMIFQVSNYVAEEDKSMSSVAANMVIMSFGYIFHSLIGNTIAWAAASQGVDGFKNAETLISGMAIIPVFLAISSFILFAFIRKQRLKQAS